MQPANEIAGPEGDTRTGGSRGRQRGSDGSGEMNRKENGEWSAILRPANALCVISLF